MIRRSIARGLRAVLQRDLALSEAFQHEINLHQSSFSLRDGFFGAKQFLTLGFPRNKIEYKATLDQLSQCAIAVRKAWDHLGSTSPHFSVISDAQFHPDNLAENIDHFWASGHMEASVIKAILDRHGVADLARKVCVEYGCGVGRVTNAIAPIFQQIYGYDISSRHLDIANKRSNDLKLKNCDYCLCSDFSTVTFKKCDVFYSRLVLQHNPPPLIYESIRSLLTCLRIGGIAIFQVPTYIIGYQFEIEDWLSTDHPLDMQMHCLPQEVIFSLIGKSQCELLELQQDDSTGLESIFISNLFVVRKTQDGSR